ncbi:hypothetical protein E2C01_041990 [Portunus trituberculatus]|uniref:Uncharacterized protein n=1 Tax=Portunus trituberculatus TaxID=210409 RepID=A0A5B7FT59_PORTR|nr:hypothetical protein [Portunus trituberculatus]
MQDSIVKRDVIPPLQRPTIYITGRQQMNNGNYTNGNWHLTSTRMRNHDSPAWKPLPRVRKSNLHSYRGQDSNPYTWETPRTPKHAWFHCTMVAPSIFRKWTENFFMQD